jgi:hypothetical protein
MNKSKVKRQAFSSPAQLKKMTMMVMQRWDEVWPVAAGRCQQGQTRR